MKSKFLFCCFISLVINARSQISPTTSYNIPPDKLRPEEIALHLNSTFFLTGESLLFKVYCFDKESGEPTHLSSIAYVELIGEDQRPLTQMKIRLENGEGSGDFFFAGNTPTGNYTLIAYTKWMRNFDPSGFFRSNISVINPLIKVPIDSVTFPDNGQSTHEPDRNPGLSIHMDKDQYGLREKVTVTLTADTSVSAALSVNVRSVDNKMNSSGFWQNAKQPSTAVLNEIRFLPDLRGELISGRITRKSSGKPLAKGHVSLSFPSKSFDFLMSTTDSAGRYYFNVSRLASENMLLKIHGHSPDDFVVHHDNSFLGEYGQFVPSKIRLETNMRQLMAKRHLSLQVENAFYAAKKDSVISADSKARFVVTPDKIYNLDDFTRFPTMDDIFREIIPEVVVRSRKDNFSLIMMNSITGFRFENSPLVMIDGIPVADANIVMKYDPILIKTISLVTQHYFYGGIETDGIVIIETYEGGAKDLNTHDGTRLSYIAPQRSKIYYSPQYDKDDLARIPDFRTQLYWCPAIKIDAGDTEELIFFTGDLSGDYFVEVVGITSDGKKVYWREVINIRKDDGS